MELRSKSQREAAGPDVADRDLSGEAVIRLAHDPSLPVLSPVRLQTTPVLSDSNTDDAEQRQEHAHTTPESGTLTLVTASAHAVSVSQIQTKSIRECQRIRGYFYNEMRYINLRFTYLLT